MLPKSKVWEWTVLYIDLCEDRWVKNAKKCAYKICTWMIHKGPLIKGRKNEGFLTLKTFYYTQTFWRILWYLILWICRLWVYKCDNESKKITFKNSPWSRACRKSKNVLFIYLDYQSNHLVIVSRHFSRDGWWQLIDGTFTIGYLQT